MYNILAIHESMDAIGSMVLTNTLKGECDTYNEYKVKNTLNGQKLFFKKKQHLTRPN